MLGTQNISRKNKNVARVGTHDFAQTAQGFQVKVAMEPAGRGVIADF